jgi:GTP-binding protein
MLVSSLDYSPFLGRLAIGKITSGALMLERDVVVAKPGKEPYPARITKIYRFKGTEKVETERAGVGEIVAVAGMESVFIGETLTDPLNPVPLPGIAVDPPTVAMNFVPNDSPFYGREGRFVTSRHIRERLLRETLSDVALVVEEIEESTGYRVSGRGELHLSILIEKMRREGYEFQVTRPQVLYREENGVRLEPYEELTVDVDENYMGRVIENLGGRKGLLLEMKQESGMARLTYKIPTRGMGVMNYVFSGFDRFAGEIRNRTRGVLIAMDECTTVAYALFNLQERGRLFLGPGERVYTGQIIGEHSRETDLVVNPAKGKKLTNMRAAGSDDAVILTPHTKMSLEECISYINDDELVEITPVSIRLRKQILGNVERRRAKSAA